jgi:hypothetical protein
MKFQFQCSEPVLFYDTFLRIYWSLDGAQGLHFFVVDLLRQRSTVLPQRFGKSLSRVLDSEQGDHIGRIFAIGTLFTLGSHLQIIEVAQFVGYFLPQEKIMY